jgi:hypothetical protein
MESRDSMKRKDWKKLGIGLLSFLVLGGGVYIATTGDSEPMKDKDTSTEMNKKYSPLDKVKDYSKTDDSKIVEKSMEGNKKSKQKVIDRNKSEKTSNSSAISDTDNFRPQQFLADASIKNSLVTFDKQAQTVDKKKEQEESKQKPIGPTTPNVPEQPIVKPVEPPVVIPPVVDPVEPPIVTPPTEPPVTPPTEPEEPEEIVVDYSALEKAVATGKEIKKELYLSEGVLHFSNEMLVSSRVLTDKDATQAQVDKQLNRLLSAIKGLVLRGDKTELEKTMGEARAVDREIYTVETLEILAVAMKQGQATMDNSEVTQEQVDEARNLIQSALDGLVEIGEPNLSLIYLNRLIVEVESLDLDLYTPDSVTNLNNVLAEAKNLVSQTEGITEEMVQAQLESLQAAKDNLIKKADKTGLSKAIDDALLMDASLYTTESWALFLSTVESGRTVLSDENATQLMVDEAEKYILTGEKDLILKGELDE